jgi:hypothetical protein
MHEVLGFDTKHKQFSFSGVYSKENRRRSLEEAKKLADAFTVMKAVVPES